MCPIVYLHGFASAPTSTKAQFFREQLESAGAHVTIPDLAAGNFEQLTISAQLSVIEKAAHGAPVRLMGSSMGGWLAALYASTHPEVERLVLLAPAFGFNRRWPERLGEAQMEKWRRDKSLPVYHYGDRSFRRVSYGLIEDAARYADFPGFRQPALIFHGLHDDIVPVRNSEAFASTHANAKLHVLDSGHDLLDVMAEIAPRVVEFLTGA
jgi:pimeloyl-ACP methyl ester carboxylesterase